MALSAPPAANAACKAVRHERSGDTPERIDSRLDNAE